MSYWWISYAAPDRHLGVCIIRAPSGMKAIGEAIRQGCSPGGSVRAGRLPHLFVPEHLLNHLFDEQEQRTVYGVLHAIEKLN